MDINLTRQEFLGLKKWINTEVSLAEGYIEKELNNPEKKGTIMYLQAKIKQLKPICDKINKEYDNIKIIVNK
jgi:hypothetical protein